MNKNPKFKVGQTVIYQNGETLELGVVKEVVYRDHSFSYRVYYSMGDTSAMTDEGLLKPIKNSDCFQIIRKDVNNKIQTQRARQMANRIIELLIPLTGEAYYDAEDEITFFIENYKEKEEK